MMDVKGLGTEKNGVLQGQVCKEGDGYGTYVADMTGKNLTCELEIAAFLGWEYTLFLVQPAGQLLGHAMTKVFSHWEHGVIQLRK